MVTADKISMRKLLIRLPKQCLAERLSIAYALIVGLCMIIAVMTYVMHRKSVIIKGFNEVHSTTVQENQLLKKINDTLKHYSVNP